MSPRMAARAVAPDALSLFLMVVAEEVIGVNLVLLKPDERSDLEAAADRYFAALAEVATENGMVTCPGHGLLICVRKETGGEDMPA